MSYELVYRTKFRNCIPKGKLMDKFVIRIKEAGKNAGDPKITVTVTPDECHRSTSSSTSSSTSISRIPIPKVSKSKKVNFSEKDGRIGRSFQIHWTTIYKWINYDKTKGKVFCNVCCKAVNEIKTPFICQTVGDSNALQSFVTDGFNNWKKAIQRFKSHESSRLHRSSTLVVTSSNKGVNVESSLSKAKLQDMKDARDALYSIVTSLRYLAVQNLAIRGHTDKNSNLTQLLDLRADDNPVLKSWLSRSKYKWVSHDIVNEILRLLSKYVQRNVINEIKQSEYYAIMIDETSDITVKEQVSICFRVVNKKVKIEEYFLGFYETDQTSANSLYLLVKDVLLRFSLNIDKCRGQCYDGAANVSGVKTGLQARINEIEKRAIYVHCAAHRLNLIVQDSLRNITDVRNFIQMMQDLITFVRNSPKRLACFIKLQADTESEDQQNISQIKKLRPFCPTRWCLRIVSLRALLENYKTALQFLDNISKTDKSDAGAKASGFLRSLQQFDTMFLFITLITVFTEIERVNGELQSKSLNYHSIFLIISNLKSFLQYQRDNGFAKIWEATQNKAGELGIDEPALPRKRKIPAKFDSNPETAHYSIDVEEKYRQLFFQVIDLTMQSLEDRFDNDTISFLLELENFAIGKSNVDAIIKFYGNDFDGVRLTLHRDMLIDIAQKENILIKNLTDIIEYLKVKDESFLDMISEFGKFIILILTIPTSTCTAERSLSSLRRVKTYLRSTMSQERLNHLALLHVHKDQTMNLNLEQIINEFIGTNVIRRNTFMVFK